MKSNILLKVGLYCIVSLILLSENSSFAVGVLSLHPQNIPHCIADDYGKSKYYITMPLNVLFCVLGDEVKINPNFNLTEQGYNDEEINEIYKNVLNGKFKNDPEDIFNKLKDSNQ